MLGCKDKRIKKSEFVADDFDIFHYVSNKNHNKHNEIKDESDKNDDELKKIPINQIKMIKKLPSDGS